MWNLMLKFINMSGWGMRKIIKGWDKGLDEIKEWEKGRKAEKVIWMK